ncbi:hypothetical protein P5673_021465 [Acropora cervicornis]|uniref:Uncharacterized protein n=1 Tax=Acropora cervicornis TaxID=6130 RepID=A0AAD9Q871_ACRCE|nr:hypothetical protein P5673_021465 [Acropora cervicornis]
MDSWDLKVDNPFPRGVDARPFAFETDTARLSVSCVPSISGNWASSLSASSDFLRPFPCVTGAVKRFLACSSSLAKLVCVCSHSLTFDFLLLFIVGEFSSASWFDDVLSYSNVKTLLSLSLLVYLSFGVITNTSLSPVLIDDFLLSPFAASCVFNELFLLVLDAASLSFVLSSSSGVTDALRKFFAFNLDDNSVLPLFCKSESCCLLGFLLLLVDGKCVSSPAECKLKLDEAIDVLR